MKFNSDFEQDGGKFIIKEYVPNHIPVEYRRRIFEDMKRQVGMKLYELIEHTKNPVTIEINERISKINRFEFSNSPYILPEKISDDLVEIEVRFTPVEHRRVTLLSGYVEQVFTEPTLLDKWYVKIRKWIYGGRQ